MMNSAMTLFLRSRTQKVTKYVHSVMFGKHNLLLTNALISATMGAIGDSIQQNYDLMMETFKSDTGSPLKAVVEKNLIAQSSAKCNLPNETNACVASSKSTAESKYSFERTIHMTCAGLSTGVVTHYWYIFLDNVIGIKRTPLVLAKKILLDQVVFSPVNLFVYFATLGLCEQSSWNYVRKELMEKGFENIYVAEWIIWPPMQLINFALLPLRYRILFDNIVSLGFDIYSPYVKYKTTLRDERETMEIETK